MVRSKISGSVNDAPQPLDERVVDAGVVDGEALGVLDGQSLLLAQRSLIGSPHRAVEVLVEALRLHRSARKPRQTVQSLSWAIRILAASRTRVGRMLLL